jgi:hypothetical protein
VQVSESDGAVAITIKRNPHFDDVEPPVVVVTENGKGEGPSVIHLSQP